MDGKSIPMSCTKIPRMFTVVIAIGMLIYYYSLSPADKRSLRQQKKMLPPHILLSCYPVKIIEMELPTFLDESGIFEAVVLIDDLWRPGSD